MTPALWMVAVVAGLGLLALWLRTPDGPPAPYLPEDETRLAGMKRVFGKRKEGA